MICDSSKIKCGDTKIMVSDSNTGNAYISLDQHPVSWKKIKDKNEGFTVFGYVEEPYDESGGNIISYYYPAVRVYNDGTILFTKRFDGTNWGNLTPGQTFYALNS